MYSNRLKSFIKEPNGPGVNSPLHAENMRDPPERTARSTSRSRSQCSLQTSRIQDLNQYKVLPSIQRRISGSEVDLDPHQQPADAGTCSSDGESPAGSSTWSSTVCGESSSLLLAIRAPCGERFVQHFLSSDTLQTVIINTEQRLSSSFTGASIHTMDVPHRTFTELNMTLEQTGISNRSVLVITQQTQLQET